MGRVPVTKIKNSGEKNSGVNITANSGIHCARIGSGGVVAAVAEEPEEAHLEGKKKISNNRWKLIN